MWKDARGKFGIKNCCFLGQEWGSSEDEPWIGLHGWLDNSGTFQTLAPFFAKNKKRLLAIDLPGHGYSSHYGPGDKFLL